MSERENGPWTVDTRSRCLRHASGDYHLVLECFSRASDEGADEILRSLAAALNKTQLQALRSQHNGSIPPEGKGCFVTH
jgi:hypothetical protein